ncbi:MAG TPA: hypothetical protein VKY89_11480 [Thermoanaerobaculia bacterium]|nr:hypothetical protein [Thermoanaerobaculia bacterium]
MTRHESTATAAAVKVMIAPVALMIDLVRVVPGREDDLADQGTCDQLMFNVLGEWDVLRLSLVTSFFPRPSGAQIWPPLSVPIHNQHSFLAHIWLDDNGELPPALHRGEDGRWRFSAAFANDDLPVTLLLCIKLNPIAVNHIGVEADHAAVRYLVKKANERRLSVLPAGSIGWQEIIFVVRSRSFDEARELVRDACRAPLSSVWPTLPREVGEQAIAARTITYPCTSFSAYLSPEADSRLGQETCRAKLLLNIRPGAPIPLRQGLRALGFGDLEYQQAAELFGDYDLELSFSELTPLTSVLKLTHWLRHVSLQGEYRDWITATNTVLDFSWDKAEAPSRLPLTVKRIEVGIAAQDAGKADAILGAFRWSGVEAIHSERLLSIFRHVLSYSNDPLLADSVAPLQRFFFALLHQMVEFRSQLPAVPPRDGPHSIAIEPNDIDHLCYLLEFSLRQRSEGLQQFLFNGLPSSYYGRGGLNRLLVGADAILQEVSDIFNMVTPGFVIFGISDLEGFNSYGPIVIGPIPALFKLERWWVLYNEAGLYIDDHLFRCEFHVKLIADIITLALPFSFDLDLLSLMAAEQMATFRPAEEAYRLVAHRFGVLAVLQTIAGELTLPDADALTREQVEDLAIGFEERLEAFAAEFPQPVAAKIDAVVNQFFAHLLRFTPMHRVSKIPKVDLVAVRERVSAICKDLAAHCASARWQHQDLMLAVGLLANFLHRRVRVLRGRAGLDTPSPPGEIGMKVDSIADLAYAAMRRWKVQLEDPTVRRTKDAPDDVQDRLADALSVWHKGITEPSPRTAVKGGFGR